MRWRFYVEDQPWQGRRSLFVQVSDPSERGRFGVVAVPSVQWLDSGALAETATLTEGPEAQADGLGDVTNFLQAALDAAWGLGMRPIGFADHTNELTAVRYHLEDMRALAKVPPR